MRVEAKNLIFISRVLKDGSGVEPCTEDHIKFLTEGEYSKLEMYNILPLSITNQTYIAQNFNVYVVKLKNK
jgi:hypothetical protein